MSKTLRQRVHRILSPHTESGQSHRFFEYILMALIVTNVCAVMLETVNDIGEKWRGELFLFEAVSVAIFTIEYVLRIWTSVEPPSHEGSSWSKRLRYMLSPMAIVDLLAIVPFYLSMFIAIDLRTLRLLRLTRLIKLGRYSHSMQNLINVFRKEIRVLAAALSVLMIIMIIAATGIHFIEKDVQPEHFGSIPASLWWALVTLTTVGYGDVVPVTILGKIFGGFIIILGVGVFALPAGILASSFTAQMHSKRSTFRRQVLKALADGNLTQSEMDKLHQLKDTLDLDDEDLQQVIRLFNQQNTPQHCPHCGGKLHNEDSTLPLD